jgi:uncharacterized protein (TIGR03437 family)
VRIHQKIATYCISVVSLFGQSAALQPAIGAAGYAASGPLIIAPGQLLTLFVPNFGSTPTGLAKAPPGALPTSLAGISAVLRQGSDQPLPIFEVRPISTCSTGSPPPANSCGSTLAVTVQIPFNIQTVCPLCERPISLVPSQIAVSVNGVTGPFADLTAVADQVHFLTACDVVMPGSTSLQSASALPCTAMVTHADGKLVSASNPARTGEELVAYASGLGQTNPPLTSAQALITGVPTLTVFAIDFNYRPNSLAAKPLGPSLSGSVPPSQTPLYTGATPGFVGLYQINFIVPPAPIGLPPCVDLNRTAPYANVVQSNLTVSVGSIFSFDGAGICVQPGG